MRAAILLGFMYLADKVGVNEVSEGAQEFLAWIVIIFVVMDVLEFFKRLGD